MLMTATRLIDFGSMAVTLWFAIYLLGRGFPSRIALRAVVVLFALSLFFASAYINLFYQIPGNTTFRAILLVVGMATWYSLTYHLTSARNQKRLRWFRTGIYLWGITVALLLLASPPFIDEAENLLWVGRMGIGPAYFLYGLYQVVSCGGILYNLLSDTRIGLTSQGKYLLAASIFPIAAAGYGILALAITPPMPRVVEDLLIFVGVFLLGVSVARNQMMVSRRITSQGFLVSGASILGLAGVFGYFAWQMDLPAETVGAVTFIAILTHSIYDLIREFLERMRSARESTLRKQFEQLEREGSDREQLQQSLQRGLDLLCDTIRASGGFVAGREGDGFVVTATRHALPIGFRIPASDDNREDIYQPTPEALPDIKWVAPVFEADMQVAMLGLGRPQKRLEYSANDLELLSEVAERVGTLVSLSNAQPDNTEKLRQFVNEMHTNASNLRSRADEMMGSIVKNPDPQAIKMVEEGLRQISDCIALGELPLGDWLRVSGESHIERGKKVQDILLNALDALRPEGPRPREPLPRVWYNYAILYDSYVEGVTNREVMARLYISEGTFNRTRRNALRGVTRLLMEKRKVLLPA